MLLVLVIFLGAGFGGSFVGGVIYGQNLAENAEDDLSPRLGSVGQIPGGGQDANVGQRGQGRQGQGGGPTTQGQGGPVEARQGESAGDAGAATEGRGMGRGIAAAQTGGDGNGVSSTPAAVSTESGRAAERTTQGNASRGGAVGTVQGLEGDVMTLASPRGELAITLSEATRFFQVSETGRESLAAESRVRVLGSRNPEGGIAAQSVTIVPEGLEDLFGSGGSGGRQRGQAR